MCIIEVCLGEAGQILEKTLYMPLFNFWTTIQINCAYAAHYVLFMSTHAHINILEVSFLRKKKKKRMVNSQWFNVLSLKLFLLKMSICNNSLETRYFYRIVATHPKV